MNGQKRAVHSISGLFAFALIGLFAVCALLMVVVCIQSYRGMGDTTRLSSQERSALGYVSGKLRACGDAGAVSFRDEGGVRLLVIAEVLDGTVYETRIYHADGALREQFCDAALAFDPADGEQIAELPGFTFERRGPLITLRATLLDGSDAETDVALRAA